MPGTIRAATRGSDLALRQTAVFAEAIRAADPSLSVESRLVRTEGDRKPQVSLSEAGGQGIFVKDIEKLLLSGDVEVAVHSLKDMPPEQPAELAIGAVLQRGDVRDALVTTTSGPLDSLAAGARIGTDSRRRAVQLLALRPDLSIEGIRGNVPRRIEAAKSGRFDAVVLAVAGLERLGLLDRAGQVFSLEEMLPAPGQAAIAIQCRAGDSATLAQLAGIDHLPSRQAVEAERGFLSRLGAGCRLPVAAHAVLDGGEVHLRAMLADEDGRIFSGERRGAAERPELIGSELAEQLSTTAGVPLEARPV